eukprot:CAMPEP_0184368442 /NCGR_PEP_ID=MMETSP1089-20130417/161665_1 /TAXON_ID=38269 ORGANISM="Gloeochaete wittrockiana, Strain SAG46.84" /NCGR_SAMPLE_ID=MMETSP1089 /ASSEMBLY_ACC=CAM_ASM_000445 /LENGTH=244 /DNA_ID=CAMNT_0026710725 /DNA_START=1630 /DNA_END=2364 /DNA_ORIENTATION=+
MSSVPGILALADREHPKRARTLISYCCGIDRSRKYCDNCKLHRELGEAKRPARKYPCMQDPNYSKVMEQRKAEEEREAKRAEKRLIRAERQRLKAERIADAIECNKPENKAKREAERGIKRQGPANSSTICMKFEYAGAISPKAKTLGEDILDMHDVPFRDSQSKFVVVLNLTNHTAKNKMCIFTETGEQSNRLAVVVPEHLHLQAISAACDVFDNRKQLRLLPANALNKGYPEGDYGTWGTHR